MIIFVVPKVMRKRIKSIALLLKIGKGMGLGESENDLNFHLSWKEVNIVQVKKSRCQTINTLFSYRSYHWNSYNYTSLKEGN